MNPVETKQRRYGWFLILAVGLLYALTVRPGQGWGDDFAMYLLHARNLAGGTPYAETGYLVNPMNFFLGPKTYPPVYPLALAPVYKVLGPHLGAMKLENILFFLACLLLCWRAFERALSFPSRVALLLLVGLNPVFWSFKDRVLPDVLFLLLLLAGLAFTARCGELAEEGRLLRVHALAAGPLLYLPYGTRSAGLVLAISFFLYSALRFRKLARFAFVALLTFAALALFQNIYLHSDAGYSYLLQDRSYLDAGASQGTAQALQEVVRGQARKTAEHGRIAASALSTFLDNGHSRPLRFALSSLVALGALLGWLVRARRHIGVFELFTVCYSGFFLVGPVAGDMRYLSPLVPLLFFYCLAGIEFLGGRLHPRAAKGLLGGVLLLAAGSYLGAYDKLEFGPIPEGVGRPETVAFFDFVKENTTAADVFIFARPRALAFYTGRAAAAYQAPKFREAQYDEEAWAFFGQIRARYLVAGPPDDDYWRQFLQRHQQRLRPVFSNPSFVVYQITEAGEFHGPDTAVQASSGI